MIGWFTQTVWLSVPAPLVRKSCSEGSTVITPDTVGVETPPKHGNPAASNVNV